MRDCSGMSSLDASLDKVNGSVTVFIHQSRSHSECKAVMSLPFFSVAFS